MSLIKCCGMFRHEDIAAVNAAKPDMCGFVVNFPKSHRSLSPAQVAELREELAGDIEAVGVFVNEDPEVIAAMVEDCVIDIVQLHGSEDEDYIAQLRSMCDAPIVKAFKIRSAEDVAAACDSSAELVLLDNGTGTGQSFDWSLLKGIDRPFILAGGLNPGNIGQAIRDINPWALDLSSGLETDKRKDAALIASAVAECRKATRGE